MYSICVYMGVWASLVAQMVKNLPAVCKTWVLSPGQEDPLEKGMASHSSILAWRIPWTESQAGYSPWDHISILQSVLAFYRETKPIGCRI